jgi:hypothetical protein
MDINVIFNLFVLLMVILVIVVIVAMLIVVMRQNRERQQVLDQLKQSLGLTQVDPNEKLLRKISQLYRSNSREKYAMSNVAHQSLPDGELLLFDLEETSGSDNTTLETQAVAVIAPGLSLPEFNLFPKAHLSTIINQALEMIIPGKRPLDVLQEYPALASRYVIRSPMPEAMGGFLTPRIANYFVQTEMYTLRAAGNLFIFSEIDPLTNMTDLEKMQTRIQHALDVLAVLQQE